MIQSASNPYILLLDDDSYPIETEFMDAAAEVMERNPQIGVMTFPQRSDEFPETLSQTGFGSDLRVGTFTSSGSVIRQVLFNELGGFPDYFFHAYEEPDYAIRVMSRGYWVVQNSQLTVRHHFTGTMRNEGRTHRRHARNECWSTIMRAPLSLLWGVLLYRVFSQLRYAARRGLNWVWREPIWWGQAASGIGKALSCRNPVTRWAYLEWVRIHRNGEVIDLARSPIPGVVADGKADITEHG